MRWAYTLIKRFLPAGVPLVIVATLAVVFELQNYTTFTRKDDFLLVTDEQLAVQYKTYSSGDPERKNFVGPEYSIPVAKKTVLTRRTGLGFYDRGHHSSFEAELPEFLIDSPFLKTLSQQLCDDYKQSATEFTTVDWSLVLDGFREPSHSLRNWEGTITVDFAYVTPKAVSLIEFYWEFTGGVHGNGGANGQCFVDDHGSVRRLKLEDLFHPNSDWKKRLIEYCVSDLRCQGASFITDALVQNPDSATTLPDSYCDLKQFSTSDLISFTLSPEGLRFYFSPYHVGSYADGVFTVGVPHYVIRDCIPEESPARLFMTTNTR